MESYDLSLVMLVVLKVFGRVEGSCYVGMFFADFVVCVSVTAGCRS